MLIATDSVVAGEHESGAGDGAQLGSIAGPEVGEPDEPGSVGEPFPLPHATAASRLRQM